jgi:hypothetical protein
MIISPKILMQSLCLLTARYRRKVLKLAPDEQMRLIFELFAHIRQRVIPKQKCSILELSGLGKEIWHGIDAQEYVDRERNSWNG